MSRELQRRLAIEALETRWLMAIGPQLFAARPDQGELLTTRSIDIVRTSPSEIRLLFQGGADIDPATLANGVRLARSGFDDNFANGDELITPAYLSLGDSGANRNEIVMRFGQVLPDDLYRLEVFGQDISPTLRALRDSTGNPFIPANPASDRDTITFNLDLGAQPIAVVPQPVTRTAGVLSQARDTVLVYLNNDDLDPVLAAAPSFYRLIDTRGTLSPADDQLFLPNTVAYSATTDTATLVFDNDNNSATPYSLPTATWRLDVGLSDEPNDLTARAVRVGSLYNTAPYSTLSYLGDGNNTSTQAADVDLYRVNLRAGSTVTITVAPTAALDVAVRLLRADGTTVVATTAGTTGGVGATETRFNTVGLPATEDYFVEVTGVGGTVGGYRLGMSVGTSLTSSDTVATTDDDDSSFATANNVGVLGDAGALINAAITPPTLLLPQYPGGNDEPGHRDITPDPHSDTYGVGPVASNGIATRYYNFAVTDPNNQDPGGVPYPNLITAEERQLVRDIYEIYGSLTGIQFVETSALGFDPFGNVITRVMVGDLRAATPTSVNGPGGIAGLGGASIVVLDALEGWGSREFGSGFFDVMFHEIGHSLGLGHSYDVPSNMGGDFTTEPVFPGDADIIHLNRLHRPDNIDIDLYKFTVQDAGSFTAEIHAERRATSTLLDSVLRLYRENSDGTQELIAQNDDYFSDDSYIELALTAGTYYVGVSSAGNDQYNPAVLNSGFGGRTQGNYDLRLSFLADPARSLLDTTNTPFDGDVDGIAGGQFQFWFNTGNTLFVDKMADTIPSLPQGNGALATPFDSIASALAVAAPGDIVRIVGNGGADGNVATTADNRPYLVGFANNNTPLIDGAEFLVPRNVTVMIDAGALLKMRLANIDVGTNDIGNLRDGGALQVLGTPTTPVYFRSLRDDTIGGDSDGASVVGPRTGDWGGLVFRDDSDREGQGVFLNWVSHANMNNGGGKVFVGSTQAVYTPIHLESARPTIFQNTITNSADAAISADPNSFADQIVGNTDKRLQRFGPEIHGNTLAGSTVNGLFVRIKTDAGQPLDQLDVTARFDDKDIVHVITENLLITGNSGGALDLDNNGIFETRTSGRLLVEPGLIVKLGNARVEAQRGSAQVIAEGTDVAPIVFTSLNDDTYGTGGTFDTNGDGSTAAPSPGDWGGFFFNHVSRGSFDHAQISYAGGETPIEGTFASFAPIEAQQATLRVTNSLLENNADGADGSNRNGRMGNFGSTIFVRGAQPVIVNNVIRDNAGPAININLNSLDAVNRKDYGRSTGAVGAFTQYNDNYGPLVRLNRMAGNATNGLEIRADELTTESIWDDTDIVHVVRDDIGVGLTQNHHTYSGLRLQSSVSESLVVKLDGDNAGFSVNGELHELEDRIGTSIHVLGTAGHPVILTALSDCTVGAGFTPDGQPQNDTIAGGTCGTSVVTTAPPFADILVVIDESSSMGPLQEFTEQMIPELEVAFVGAGIGDGTSGFNRYGLVGYGGPSATAGGRTLNVGAGPWGTSVEYVTAAQNLVTIAGAADGYKGLDFALANYAFRGSAAKFIILVTDTNRESFFGGGLSPSTPASLLAQLSGAGITLQTIINARFEDGAGTSAIAVDSNSTAYLPDGLGGYTTSPGGVMTFQARPNIKRDYIDLGWATGGISGDIEPIAAGGNDLTSFTLAFTETIVSQAQVPVASAPGEWRSIRLGQYSNDRNVAAMGELEASFLKGVDLNGNPGSAQSLGVLAPDEKSGDENRRLGFEVLGRIAYDDPNDRDVYSFTGTAGTRIWIDIDRTDSTLDSKVELVTFAGTSTAGSDDSMRNATLSGTAGSMLQNVFLSDDNYTLNPKDAGFSVVLPGTAGQTGTYFVRVSSDGKTTGHYQLQVRLRQQDEEPGSTIQYSNILNSTTGIEVIGLPARSNLAGESGENGDASGNAGAAQSLGNLLVSDRNTVSVAGELLDGSDVDFYNVNLTMAQIQRIDGVNADTTIQWPVVFDVDYADGLVRPDSTLSVFDSSGRLILIGRESSVEDDQPASPGVLSLDDLSRGSVGKLDPFIGPVVLNEGTNYNVAVTSNQQMSIQLNQFSQMNPTNPLTRLEPLESVTRVVEDHIGTSGYLTSNLTPVAPTTSVFDIDTVLTLDTHIKTFTLDDVRLYVSTDTTLFSVDAESANNQVNVGTAGTTSDRLRDIVIRSDGLLYGYRDRDGNTVTSDNSVGDTVGSLVNYNPGNAAQLSAVNDGIRGPLANVAFTPSTTVLDVTYSDGVEALTFRRNSWVDANTVDYDLYYSVTDSLAGARFGGTGYSKLYEDLDGPRPDGTVNQGNANRGFVGYIGGATRGTDDAFMGSSNALLRLVSAQPGVVASLTVAQNNAGNGGNTIVAGIEISVVGNTIAVTIFTNNGGRVISAQNLVDAINAFTAARAVGTVQLNSGGGNRVSNGTPDATTMIPNPLIGAGSWTTGAGLVGTLLGRTTGMAFVGGTLYGVSDRGEFYSIDTGNASTTTLRTYAGVSFQGLALGPQNVDENRDGTPDYANLLFAIDAGGTLRALDPADPAADLAVFEGGATSLDTGIANPTGLAFSNLDFNLWHPTNRLGAPDNAGHGINGSFNGSRPPVAGGTSFYFGLEDFNTGAYLPYNVLNGADGQFGVTQQAHRDLSTNPLTRNTYDLPGGAKGTLLADSFSLAGYSRFEKPTLYFNYFLQTEGANGAEGAMRDSARAFISQDNGTTWELVASNNSARGNEIAPVYTHDSTSNPNANPLGLSPTLLEASDIRVQQVQELFDANQWRQARVDLSRYAGQANLRLRFDFATAGAIDEFGLPGEANGSLTSAARGQANNFAGFYVDDIIVGFSERGELVTGALGEDTRMTATNNVPLPAPPPQLAGRYQLEIRPGADYGGNTVSYNAPGINRIFDTNDRLVQEDTLTGTTPSDTFTRTELRTTTSLPWQTGGFSDWIVSANRANANLSTVGIFDPNNLASSQFTVLQISLETRAGNVAFTEFSSFFDADAVFFIDGVNVDGFLATGFPDNGFQSYFVEAGLHTYTWVGAKFAVGGSTAIDNITFPAAIVGTGDKGDDNFFREQGQLILRNNKISNALLYGIEVDAGTRDPNQNLPHPGVPINFNTLNTNRWVPGVVIENNILDGNVQAGIRFAGDASGNPLAVAPFGRIVNNTIYGGRSPSGTGVIVTDNASPTILNNIFANTVNAITTAGAGQVVIGSNLFHNNTSPTLPSDPLAGSTPLFGLDTDPLFNSAAVGVFYPAIGSVAIDSSLNVLQDRADFVTVKTPLGIPHSAIFAPDYDVYGQLRVDDTSADPLGGGSSIFKDRGAVESADFIGPYAQLLRPLDNADADADPNQTVVFRRTGLFTEFSILLSDGPGSPFPNEGTGVDTSTVLSSTTGLSNTVTVKRDGVLLKQNVDYMLGYSGNNQTLLITPLSEVWEPNHVYEILLANADIVSIRDYAGNRLRANQPDGSVRFTIILGDVRLDYGDAAATIAGNLTFFPTTLAQDGARHVQLLGGTPLLLGSVIDTENDAVPSASLDGDDRAFVLTFSAVPPSTLVLTTPPATFQVPAGSGSLTVGVTDGESFTINDGVHAPVTFELNLAGGLLNVGAIEILVDNTRDRPDDVALAIATAIQGQIAAGNLTDVRPVQTGDTVQLLQFGVDDEDGVDFSMAVFNAGTTITDLTITSTGVGFVDAWVDFNNDGTFQASEQILTSEPVVAGANAIALVNITPVGSFIGVVNSRFRISQFGGLTAGGVVAGGEVEDYPITILPGTPPVAVDDAYLLGVDPSLSVPAKGVLANDTDAENPVLTPSSPDPVIALLVSGPMHAIPGGFTLNADGSFSYMPPPDFYGTDTFVYRAQDSDGLISNNRATVTITVDRPLNDAPVTTAPTTVVTDEDVTYTFSGGSLVSIADDSLAAPIQITLTATNGVMSLSGIGGLNFSFSDGFGTNAGDGTADAVMTFRGALADINAALNGLTFTSPQNFNGTGTIVIGVNDLGNTGIGGALTDLDTITIGVAAVNDPPVNSFNGAPFPVAPVTATVAEDTTLTFSSGLGRQISVADLEAGLGSIRVTLAGVNGAVSLNGIAGLVFSAGDGTADPTMTFTGTIATINARLNGLTFRPNNNFDGQAFLVITANDLGQIGSGGPQTDVDTVTITVTPVNDAPVNLVPGTQTTPEDTTRVFSSANGNALSVSDDAGANPIEVVLTATNGAITLAGLTGLTFLVGDGTDDAAVTVRGTLADINTALNGLQFIPPLNFSGTATLRIVTNDLGSSGAGAAQSDTDTVTITVSAVNDPPVNSIPGTQTTDDEVPVVFSTGNSNRITISDIDAGTGIVRVSLTGIDGKITLPSLAGLTFTVGDGTSDGNMSFTGTIANINAAMNGLSFRPNDFFIGNAQLVISTNDNGLTGAGGQQTDTDTVTITVISVNDPPVNTIPGPQVVAEDNDLFFGTPTANAISVIDDALTLPIEVQLTATNGLLTLAGTTGLTFSVGDGTDDATMTVQGTFAAINVALNGLKFDSNPDYNGPATIVVRTNDLGNSGAPGTPLVTTSTVNVTVTAINDAPVNTVPGSQMVLEDTLLTLGGANKISVADIDATLLQVTLTVVGGTVDLSGTAGLTFTAGDGTGDALVTFRGTPSAVNTALDGLTFSPANGTSGAATITVLSSDLGGTGLGGTLTDTDVVTISVTPVNDPPTHTLPASPSVAEDSTLNLSGGNAVTVVDDAGASVVRMTMTSTNGTVALGSTSGLTFILGDGSATAAMTFTGTLADINTALTSLLFRPTTDYVGQATIVFSTEDFGNTGGGPSLTGTDTLTITVTGVNDAPVNTVPGSQSTPEDVPLVFSSGLGNQISVADIDAGVVNPVRVTLNATSGNITLFTMAGLSFTAGDGTTDATMTFTGTLASVNAALNGLTFRSAADYFGPAGIQIATNDLGNSGAGSPLGDTDTITITVTSVNDPPVASPTPRSTSEDIRLTISASSLTANDIPGPSNESAQTLTLATGTSASAQGGTVTIAGGQVVYTPALDFNGIDTFTYLVTDNGTTNGIAEPKGTFGTVTVTVQPVNDAPTAVNDSYIMNEDTTLTRSALNGVLSNDFDPEGTPLTATRISGPTTGTLSLAADGSFTYLPPPNFFGTATFTYRANDGALNSNVATVTITVQDVNEPPVANNDSAATTKNAAVNIAVLTNDTDVDGSLAVGTVQIASAPLNGTAVPQPNGTVTYTPTAEFQGSDTFQYTVRDNAGDVSNVATVSITIGPAPPIWQNQDDNLDVNADGFISPIDALLIINKLNVDGPGPLPVPAPVPPPPFFDVNGDGFIAPNDAVQVVNYLNLPSGGEGEGEDLVTIEPMAVVYGPLLAGSDVFARDAASSIADLGRTMQATTAAFADAALAVESDPSLLSSYDHDGDATEVDDLLDFMSSNDLGDHDCVDEALLELWGD